MYNIAKIPLRIQPNRVGCWAQVKKAAHCNYSIVGLKLFQTLSIVLHMKTSANTLGR